MIGLVFTEHEPRFGAALMGIAVLPAYEEMIDAAHRYAASGSGPAQLAEIHAQTVFKSSSSTRP
jgi:hypothetical protein